MAWAANYTAGSDLANVGENYLHYQIFYAWSCLTSIAGNPPTLLPDVGIMPFQVSGGPSSLNLIYSGGSYDAIGTEDFDITLDFKCSSLSEWAAEGLLSVFGDRGGFSIYIYQGSLYWGETQIGSNLTLADDNWHTLRFNRVDGIVTGYLDSSPFGTVSDMNDITNIATVAFDEAGYYVGALRNIVLKDKNGATLSSWACNEGAGDSLTDTGNANNTVKLTGNFSWDNGVLIFDMISGGGSGGSGINIIPSGVYWPPNQWPPEKSSTDAFSIRHIQEQLEILVTYTPFARKVDGGYNYHGKSEIDIYTYATLLADAGIPDGFTRHVPKEDGLGGYTVERGFFNVGDYVGSHLWNELKACLSLLQASVHQPSARPEMETQPAGRFGANPIKGSWWGPYSKYEADEWAACVADTETRFDNNSDGGGVWLDYWTLFGPVQRIEAWTSASKDTYYNLLGTMMMRVRVKATVSLPILPLAATLLYHIRARANGDWNAQGTDLVEGKYKCWEEKAYTAGDPYNVTCDDYPVLVSDSTRPTWVGEPANESVATGFIEDDCRIIVVWDLFED
jgi:hypothetical protein